MADPEVGALIVSLRRLIGEAEDTAFDLATSAPAREIAGLLNAVAQLTKATDRMDPDA